MGSNLRTSNTQSRRSQEVELTRLLLASDLYSVHPYLIACLRKEWTRKLKSGVEVRFGDIARAAGLFPAAGHIHF